MRTVDWLLMAWLTALSVALCFTIAINVIQNKTDNVHNETNLLQNQMIGRLFVRTVADQPVDTLVVDVKPWRNAWRDNRPTDSLWKVPILGVDSARSYDLNTPEGRQKWFEQTGERWRE